MEVEQPIPLFGRESARVEIARVAVRAEAAELKRVEQTVLADLLEAMASVDAARATLGLRDALAANATEQAQAAREAVDGGGMKINEERQLLSRRAQVGALRAKAFADLAAAQLRLRRLLPPGAPVSDLPRARLEDFWQQPLDSPTLVSRALAEAVALLKARAEADQAAAENELARSEFWPKLSITYQNVKGTTGGVPADSQSAFIGLSVPLYEGGSTASRAQSAAFKLAAARERAVYEERMTRQRVAEAWERWEATAAMVKAWSEAERQEQESVTLAEAQVAAGGATRFGQLRARQSQLEVQLQGVDHRLQHELAWIRMVQEAGALIFPPSQGEKPSQLP